VFSQTHPFSNRLRLAQIFLICGLGLAGLIAVVYRLGSIGLIDETEPLFAEAAREMVTSGDWVTPYYNGETRFDKPPLVYWLMAIGYRLGGVNEWMVRLPSAIAAIGLMYFVAYVVQQAVPPSRQSAAGWLKPHFAAGAAGAITLFNLHTLVWGRTGVSDMLLSACMGSALLAFFMGYCAQAQQPGFAKIRSQVRHLSQFGLPRWVMQIRRSQLWFALFYVMLALAVLTKGPVGIVLPGLIISLFLLMTGQFGQTLRSMGLWWGIPLLSILTIPWFVAVIHANGSAYIDSFFGYHNFERFTQVVNRHSAPWYFYFLVIGFGFFPWSAYLPLAIARIQPWRWDTWQRSPRSLQLPLFALCWFGVIFGFFTIAVTKLPSYVLPLMPAGAILVALILSDVLFEGQHHRILRLSHLASILLWGVWSLTLWTLPYWYQFDAAVPKIGRRLLASGIAQGAAIEVALVTCIAIFTLTVGQRRWIGCVHLVGFAGFTLFSFHPFMTEIDQLRQLPLREIAAEIQQVQQPGEPIVMVGFEKPTLVFYTQQTVTFLKRPSEGRAYLEKLNLPTQEKAANQVSRDRSTRSEPLKRSAKPASVLLISDEVRIEEMELSPDRLTPLLTRERYQLLRVSLP